MRPQSDNADGDQIKSDQIVQQPWHEQDEDAEDGRVVALQSLSNAQLIEILQHHDGNDDLAEMVEEELIRRKTQGAPQ